MAYKKYMAEFIGTFFLVLVIGMTTFSKISSDLQPLSIGLTLTALIFALGHVSGAQFNPAVTLALVLRGKVTLKDGGFYLVAQFAASFAAAWTISMLIAAKPPVPPFAAPPQYFALGQAISAEALGSFAFVYVILNVATAKSLEGNGFYGIAIGFAKAAMLYALGSVSGGYFNVAVSLATSYLGISSWSNLWIYAVGSIGGGLLAALCYKFFGEEN